MSKVRVGGICVSRIGGKVNELMSLTHSNSPLLKGENRIILVFVSDSVSVRTLSWVREGRVS